MKHDVVELLPYYANDTLDAADRARVETELASCPSCAAELRELEQLAAALKAHADAAPPVPPSVFDDALARIATPSSAIVATRLRTAWWATPARYATAAVLVVGFGAAAVAAYHAHEADVARTSAGVAQTGQAQTTTIFRVTPNPVAAENMKLMHAANASRAVGAPASDAQPAAAKKRRLAKTGRIEILVTGVEAALGRVHQIIRDNGGDLTSLDDASPRTAGAVHGAQLTIEVPAARLDGTLDTLATLGTVQNRAIDAEDVDATIVDEEARLRNLRSEEADLRTLMGRGGKVDDILTVQQNLSDVRGQIEELDAQHQHDLHRVATSTIAITLTEERANATPAQPGPSARIDGAWQSGLVALADTVVSLLSTIAWCVAYSPVLLGAAAITYAAARVLKRRPASA
jgi:cell division septum initiation protein DivIVA